MEIILARSWQIPRGSKNVKSVPVYMYMHVYMEYWVQYP